MIGVERKAIIGELVISFEPQVRLGESNAYFDTSITINHIDSPDQDEALFTFDQKESVKFVEYLKFMTKILENSLKEHKEMLALEMKE